MINSFRGEFAFLSNMYVSPMRIGGIAYTCAEAAFQAVKLEDKSQRTRFEGLAGREAKALGRRIQLRDDWESIKVDVMKWIVHQKFKEPTLRQKLLSTGEEQLVEGNTWNDTFWGVCNGKGQNMLGKILMAEREALKNE